MPQPSAVSFANTPQAAADSYSLAENGAAAGSLWVFDVMANDQGGNAKTLYSLDDGSARNDLLVKDNVGVVESSRLGASISITADGKVAYNTTSLSAAVKAQIQSLNVGESFSDSFTYAIRLGNGTLAWNTVTVTFTGENDAPVITSGPQAGTVGEDGTLSAAGQVTSSDVDHGATATWSGNGSSDLGAFTVNAANGAWNYALDNASDAVQALAAGETVIETYTVTVTDEHGATASQNVTITITGTNDGPVITSSAQSGDVAEDGTLVASGQVTSSDVDHGATAAYSGDAAGAYGAFAVNAATGEWTYTVNNGSDAVQSLADGETQSETFTVTVTDDHGATATQDVTVTITGTNDVPIAAASSAAVLEDASVSGHLSASDIDSDAFTTFAINGAAPVGFHLDDASTGAWSFDASSYDSLTAGQLLPLTVYFTATDSHGDATWNTLSLSVTGVNDNASIANDGSVAQDFSVTEAGGSNNSVNPNPSASGKLLVTDADAGEAAFQTATATALHGTYGNFTFNAANGSWTYALRNGDANVQALNAGQNVTDTLHVTSADGTASHDIVVNIAGAADGTDVVGTRVLNFTGISGTIGNYGGFDFTASQSHYFGSPDWYGTGSEVYNGWAGKVSDMVAVSGADFSVDRLDIRAWTGVHTVEFIGLNNGADIYHKTVNLTSSMQTVALDFAGIDDLRIVVTDGDFAGNGVTDTGWWMLDNLWVA